jgi:hypothetical protein
VTRRLSAIGQEVRATWYNPSERAARGFAPGDDLDLTLVSERRGRVAERQPQVAPHASEVNLELDAIAGPSSYRCAMTHATRHQESVTARSNRAARFAVQGADQLLGQVIIDREGRRVGLIRAASCEDGNPYRPTWAIVTLGPWRCRPRLVALSDADWDQSAVKVPYPAALVRLMPHACPRDLGDLRMRAVVGLLYRRGSQLSGRA